MSRPMRRITFRPSVLPSFRLSALPPAVAATAAPAQKPPCAPDNGGWTVPKGFCAVLVGDSLGQVRHLAVAPNGDVFGARNPGRNGPGGVIVLRDTTGDGKADVIATFFSGAGGSGIALTPDAVYFAPNDRVLRFPRKPG